jgi:hypothetical protein
LPIKKTAVRQGGHDEASDAAHGPRCRLRAAGVWRPVVAATAGPRRQAFKDPTDPEWRNCAGYKWWVELMDKYRPNGDKSDNGNVYGSSVAATTVQVLEQCGDNLTRENVMRQAANLHDFTLPMLQPGITVNTSPSDFAPIKQVRMERFDGERFLTFGPVSTAAIG